jgi:hypothetical protein
MDIRRRIVDTTRETLFVRQKLKMDTVLNFEVMSRKFHIDKIYT